MKKVFLKGVNVVIDPIYTRKFFIPVRSARMQPLEDSDTFAIQDFETRKTWNITLTELRDGDNNPFATFSDAEDYLAEFIGSFKFGGIGAEGPSEDNYIHTAQNYTDLLSTKPTGDFPGQLAYVIDSEGTAWLPGTLGGTYYPKGHYVWTGSAWLADKNAVAKQLQDLIDSRIISATQWNSTLTLAIPNGFFFNLFNALTDLDKVAAGTTSWDEYSITTGDIIIPYAGRPYEDLRIHHNIRLNFNIQTGSRQSCRVELRRTLDDSVIGSAITVERNPDEEGVQINFVTYTSSSTDPFVTDGFYIAFVNLSGQTITLDGPIGVLIENTFEKPLKF